MYYSLDRFEEELAVLEDDYEHTLTIPRILLPEGARPGDVLIRDGDRYSPAPDETARRREQIRRLQDKLRRR